ncbi:MAG TPA: transposase [Solirubrobacteraceae bacterium]|nr:transposase [Solirubrobacteraceae bacterium]
MPTTTKTPSTTRTQSRIELDSVELESAGLESGERAAGDERSEPGGRATRGAGGTLRAAAGGPSVGHRRELSRELIDEAVDRARLRALVELPDGGRLSDEVIDQLLAGARTEEEIAGPGGLLAELTKRLIERALEVELTEHLGYEPHQEPPGGAPNQRNGTSPKTLITEHGKVRIDAPRDRNASFEPKIVRKRQRRFVGFDDKILALYSRGRSRPCAAVNPDGAGSWQ